METNEVVAKFIETCHPEIQERMLQLQALQNNPRNWNVFKDIHAGKEEGGFDWYYTPETYDFWVQILGNGEFERFYEHLEETK